MTQELVYRWSEFVRALKTEYPSPGDAPLQDVADSIRIELDIRYSEQHRYYHTWSHIRMCLDLLDWYAASAPVSDFRAVEAAIWFHDAVYDPKAADNEIRSADLAVQSCKKLVLPHVFSEKVVSCILATRHIAGEDFSPAEQLVMDIDLAILGSPEQTFDEYEQNIRREYAWVPEIEYKEKRKRVVRHFLNQKRLYRTGAFADRFGEQARINLNRSILRLESEAS